MPYYAGTGTSDNTGMEGFGTLAAALFPDPSKLGQAQYYGAESRRADQQTSDMVATAQAKQRLGQAIQNYSAHPSQENLASIIAAGGQAGITDPRQILSGLVAGATGTGSMPQSVADAMLPGLGTPYGSTKTGTQAAEAAQTQRQVIASAPSMVTAQQGVRAYNETRNAFSDGSGKTIYLPQGQVPPEGFRPLATVAEGERQTTASAPSMVTAQQGVRAYNDTRNAFSDGSGNTIYLPPGQTPPAGYRPLATVAEGERQTTASAPSLITAQAGAQKQAGESRPYVIPSMAHRYGARIINVPVGQQPPEGAIPYDPNNPAASVTGVGTYGQSGVAGAISGAGPTVSPPGTNGPTAQPAGGAGGQTGGAGGPTVSPPGTNSPTGAGLAGVIVPEGVPNNPFEQAATGASVRPGAETAGQALQLDKLIDNRLSQYNAEQHGLGLHNDYILGDDTRTALQGRIAQLTADRTNRSTYQNTAGALNQAWSELAPRFTQDTHYVTGKSVVGLKPNQQPGASGAGAGKSTPAPKQPAADQPNAAPPPAPADPKQRTPGQVYTTLSGPMLWTGQGWQRMAQAGP